jgi:hypothetical protein
VNLSGVTVAVDRPALDRLGNDLRAGRVGTAAQVEARLLAEQLLLVEAFDRLVALDRNRIDEYPHQIEATLRVLHPTLLPGPPCRLQFLRSGVLRFLRWSPRPLRDVLVAARDRTRHDRRALFPPARDRRRGRYGLVAPMVAGPEQPLSPRRRASVALDAAVRADSGDPPTGELPPLLVLA